MPLTPIQAIRQNCLDCMGGNANEVKICPMENKCPLWVYRLGKNPNRKGKPLTEEQRAVQLENLKKARQMKREIV